MQSINDLIELLKNKIHDDFEKSKEVGRNNIFRGHLRSISADAEDGIACFISDILPQEYKLILDPSIHINDTNNRPDLLVVNEKKSVVAMIEIKSNMGYCRNATEVIDKIVSNNEKFANEKTLECEFSNFPSMQVSYGENVKLFLIALTSDNCSQKSHDKNKAYADKNNVLYMNLFSGWYYDLLDQDIQNFISELQKI